MRVMGIDYGDARTGVAFSDLLCSIVGSTTVVPSRNHEKAMLDLVRLAHPPAGAEKCSHRGSLRHLRRRFHLAV